MPALEHLTGMREFGLREFPGTAPSALARVIKSVSPFHPGDRVWPGSLTETLAVANLDEWADTSFDQLAARAARAGIAALAVVSAAGSIPPELAHSMERLRVPLLTLPSRTSWTDIAEAVTRARLHDLRRAIIWRDQLLGHLRPSPDALHLARIVRWLATEHAARVALVGSDGALVATAPQHAAHKLTTVADKVEEVAAGALESAVLESGGDEIRLVAVGTTKPRAVLAVSRESPFDRTLTQVISRTADLLALHLSVADAESAIHGQQATVSALHVAVLQLLMGGEIFKARRTAASLYPGLLDQDHARVYLLEGRAQERDRLREECWRAAAGAALVVRCPVYDSHLILVVPQPSASGDTWDGVGEKLRVLVARHPDCYLGGSPVRHIAETAQSYRAALRALANARLGRGRAALYTEQANLPELLNGLYPGWATAVLRPLLGQRATADRDVLIQALTLTLQSSVRAAAELTGAHRNTITNRVRAAAGILGVDLDSIRDRAVTALALEAVLMDESCGEASHVGPADLQTYLASPEVGVWVRTFLYPLSEELRCTLKEWVLSNGDTSRAAQALGVHAQTVRKRLRTATSLLQRDLLAADAHDVVLAIAVQFGIRLPLPVH
ncbi:helix-turn-helix domain-containing protein [Kitasatospora sp. NBC_01300]|uniref:PucR family transcriptional regulator n=1 Tax=Kitasatospora sp. NBC_01300 TaxID=2903574 RepID=UPI00352E10F6|nr:helix-turn-helix domain-containing protein [Kitasatospora sp. NBC_01300]